MEGKKNRLCGWAKASVMGAMTTCDVASAGSLASDAFLVLVAQMC
jgi:hypothetical protein